MPFPMGGQTFQRPGQGSEKPVGVGWVCGLAASHGIFMELQPEASVQKHLLAPIVTHFWYCYVSVRCSMLQCGY